MRASDRADPSHLLEYEFVLVAYRLQVPGGNKSLGWCVVDVDSGTGASDS